MTPPVNVAYKRTSRGFFVDPGIYFWIAGAVWLLTGDLYEVFLTLGIVFAFSPAINGGWVFDDWSIADEETTFQLPLRVRLRWCWEELSRRPFTPGGGGCRWFTYLGYHLTYKLWRFDMRAWHGISLALHAGAVTIFHRILLGWGASTYTAAGAAAIVAFHPLQVGAVSYISGRPGLQSVFLTLAGLWCFQLGAWPAAIVLQYLAWRSKEDSVLYWPVYPICFYWFR